MFVFFRKATHILLLIIFLTATTGVDIVSAQKTVLYPNRQDADVFTFSDLGVESDLVLKGPYESQTIRFALPPTWELQNGSELNLFIKSFFSTSGTSDDATSSLSTTALLEVYFNRSLQQTIPLTIEASGSTVRVPISVADLGVPDRDGFYTIRLALDASVDCDLEFHKTTLVIGTNSFAVFPHVEKPITLDLRKLPFPFYQERAKNIGSATVVMPQNPTADEMQAALVTMGSLGRTSQGRLPVSLVTANELTEALLTGTDLVFVGGANAIESLFEGESESPVTNGDFQVATVAAEDGLLQLVQSPWNSEKTLLIVTGKSDAGVVKAAQALSTGNLQTGITPDYSVITQVNPLVAPDQTTQGAAQTGLPNVIEFSDLDYQVTTVDEVGANYLSYEFVIPQGQFPSENPYLELNYSHSTILDPALSYISVYVNETIVGSVELTSETSGLITSKIDIPASLLRFGLNLIELEINLLPRNECSLLSFSGLWATIFEDSFLHLPLVRVPDTGELLQDLKIYPYPFANDPSLATTTIVIPTNDVDAWKSAGRVAYDLGGRINGSILSFEAAFDNQISEASRAGNFILIGEPKDLTILSEMRDVMPAYFEPGSNVAMLESLLVIYQVTDQKSLGYLEIFASPWNPQAAVLGVFGTNPEGLEYALTSLLQIEVRDTLSGNFSTYDGGNRAIVVDTRTGYGVGSFEAGVGDGFVTSLTPSPTGPATDAPAPVDNSNLILVAMGGILVVMAVVIFIALRYRKKRSN